MNVSPEIIEAVAILRAGGVVALPTETVYGLGADAANESAIRRIFAAKERPFDHPLIVHIADPSQLTDWAMDISPAAMTLAQAFWPGPLTIILKKQPHVLDIVTGGQMTVGLRIPSHPMARSLLKAFGGGVVAPSANKFTHISPTTAAAVKEELGGQVDLILDGGTCDVGLESTIINMSGIHPTILRPGMITAQAIAAVLGVDVLSSQTSHIRTPGMHHLHYAPTTKTVLVATKDIPLLLQTLPSAELPVAVVLHSQLNLPQQQDIQLIQMPPDAASYAHDIYQTLRTLDNQHLKRIIIEVVPADSNWEAIRDRLSKASASKL